MNQSIKGINLLNSQYNKGMNQDNKRGIYHKRKGMNKIMSQRLGVNLSMCQTKDMNQGSIYQKSKDIKKFICQNHLEIIVQ